MSYQYLLDDLGDLLFHFEQLLLDFLPRLIGAASFFLVGLALAYLVRFFSRRLVGKLDGLLPGDKLQRSLRRVGLQRPAADAVGGLLFWIVVLFFLTAATETLGLPIITTWLGRVALYLPRFFSAILIVFVGLIGGLLLRDLMTSAATSAGIAYAATLGRLTQIAILLFSLLIAVDQAGFNISFLTSALLILIGAILFGGALAFALGARTAVTNILASYYLQKTYKTGHKVEIGELKGEIVQITPTTVVLETTAGRATVPAKLFSEAVSVLLIERN